MKIHFILILNHFYQLYLFPDPDYEKTRERIKYDPSIHDYSTESPEWVEIRPGHFIYGSKSELANYEKELSAKESNA